MRAKIQVDRLVPLLATKVEHRSSEIICHAFVPPCHNLFRSVMRFEQKTIRIEMISSSARNFPPSLSVLSGRPTSIPSRVSLPNNNPRQLRTRPHIKRVKQFVSPRIFGEW